MNPGPPGIYPGALTTELLGCRYSRVLVGLVQIIHFQQVLSHIPDSSDIAGLSRFTTSGVSLFAPLAASLSAPPFPLSLLWPFIHLKHVGAHIVQSKTLRKVGHRTCTNACKGRSSRCRPGHAKLGQPKMVRVGWATVGSNAHIRQAREVLYPRTM